MCCCLFGLYLTMVQFDCEITLGSVAWNNQW